ncbi:MAG: hypothetical protein AAF961_03810 [Planctomycetota bacterium]
MRHAEPQMDAWYVLLILAAAYVAVVSLVRLMATRRDELVEQVREQIASRRSHGVPRNSDPGDGG